MATTTTNPSTLSIGDISDDLAHEVVLLNGVQEWALVASEGDEFTDPEEVDLKGYAATGPKIHNVGSTYAIDDQITVGGKVMVAIAANGPGAFNALDWASPDKYNPSGRVHLPATAVGAVDPAAPTLANIEAVVLAGTLTDVLCYYTGTDVIGDPVTYVYDVDKDGVVTVLDTPDVPSTRVFLAAAAVGAVAVDAPTDLEISGAIGAARSTVAFYTGTEVATDPITHVYHIDGAGVITMIEHPDHSVEKARKHVTQLAAGAVDTSAPTLLEITTGAGLTRDAILYYTGDNTSTNPPTHVYHIDKDGVVTLLQEPVAVPQAHVHLTETAVAPVIAGDPTDIKIIAALPVGKVDYIAYYTGTDVATDPVIKAWAIDTDGVMILIAKPSDPANNRMHVTDTDVGPATAGVPTAQEVQDSLPVGTSDRILYYTGDDLPASTPTFVYHVDASGIVTEVFKPSADTVYAANGQLTGPRVVDGTNAMFPGFYSSFKFENLSEFGSTLNSPVGNGKFTSKITEFELSYENGTESADLFSKVTEGQAYLDFSSTQGGKSSSRVAPSYDGMYLYNSDGNYFYKKDVLGVASIAVPTMGSIAIDRVAGHVDATGQVHSINPARFEVLSGTSAPVDNLTTGWYVGQLYIDTVTNITYRVTTAATDPDNTSSLGTVWTVNTAPTNEAKEATYIWNEADTDLAPATDWNVSDGINATGAMTTSNPDILVSAAASGASTKFNVYLNGMRLDRSEFSTSAADKIQLTAYTLRFGDRVTIISTEGLPPV